MRKFREVKLKKTFSSAKERERYEKKISEPKYTKKQLEKVKKERAIMSEKLKAKSEKLKSKVHPELDLGLPLELNYKNDYSSAPKHLPETRCLNKKLVRVALRKSK